MCQCNPECRIKGLAILCIVINVFSILLGVLALVIDPKNLQTDDTTQSPKNEENEKKIKKILKIVGAVLLVKGIIGLVCSVLLYLGVKRQNKTFVKVFFFYGIIVCISFVVTGIMMFVKGSIISGLSYLINMVILACLLHFVVKKYMDRM